ncbi:MAG: nucleotidyltransferase/DNA polymerase involved in repair, partial [Peptococcaceae bacterium]|nr:nucleotidyltransferase/DNA polymerase involved in repair [Peptococcaceae bacterium]
MDKTIFHIDVNSAYLSWEAVFRFQHGSEIDLRTIPSVVGGDQESRRGIVLARSIPAKKYSIETGEILFSAKQKCPYLVVVPPNYSLYVKCSNAMLQILREYSSHLQRFSVDEVFLDYSGMEKHFWPPVEAAYTIKDRIHLELGFTVNIGISSNKLLAKMAGELSIPNKVHTLYPHEIEEKLWPLPVNKLYMVGRATTSKLHAMGIRTIGDLAKTAPKRLEFRLKSHGFLIWRYAHGLEDSLVRNDPLGMKGLGNSTTTAFDVEDTETAHKFLLSLVETVAARLREAGYCCQLVSIGLKDTNFRYWSHQKKLFTATDSTEEIYSITKILLKECWKGQPLRQIGVHVSDLSSNQFVQYFIRVEPTIYIEFFATCVFLDCRQSVFDDFHIAFYVCFHFVIGYQLNRIFLGTSFSDFQHISPLGFITF